MFTCHGKLHTIYDPMLHARPCLYLSINVEVVITIWKYSAARSSSFVLFLDIYANILQQNGSLLVIVFVYVLHMTSMLLVSQILVITTIPNATISCSFADDRCTMFVLLGTQRNRIYWELTQHCTLISVVAVAQHGRWWSLLVWRIILR